MFDWIKNTFQKLIFDKYAELEIKIKQAFILVLIVAKNLA